MGACRALRGLAVPCGGLAVPYGGLAAPYRGLAAPYGGSCSARCNVDRAAKTDAMVTRRHVGLFYAFE